MKTIFWFAMGLFLGAFVCDQTHTANAASMEYCRPYAAKFSQTMINYIWNRAYTTCLNEDEDPTLPTRWADAVGIINGSPIDVSGIGVTPATEAIATEPTLGTKIEDLRKTRWRAQCARAFHTWDAKTETVVRKRRGRRVTCPCGTALVCK